MTDLEAPIQEVTVYADRALVTRVGSLPLSAGTHELHILNLPPFERDSLRASGQGPQGARILDVDLQTTYHHRAPEAEVQVLQDAYDQLQERLAVLRLHQETLRDRRNWLRALGAQTRDLARGVAAGQLAGQECVELFVLTSQQAQQDGETDLQLLTQEKHLVDELAARERELSSKRWQQGPDRWAAVVTVEVPQEGEFTLALSYLITQASWRPLYDVRVSLDGDGNQGQVELTYSALVQQASGEDWRQVKLALSTARPSQAAILPELHPRYLYAPFPPAKPKPDAPGTGETERSKQWAQSKQEKKLSREDSVTRSGGDAEIDDDEPDFEETIGGLPLEVRSADQLQAQVATALTQQSGTAHVFKIARSVDIPSDNSPHKTTIARDDLPCTFDYVCAPAINPVAHLRASITNTTPNSLLAGSSSIFLSGEYVGTTQIEATAPREAFKIFLGLDESLKIKYEQLERSVEKGALLQSNLRRLTYTYRITLHNYATFPRQVVLRDQLPVSQHERIKVRTLAMHPAPSERSKQELLTWSFSLPAESEFLVEYRYVVEHPLDLAVAGLS